MKPEQASRGHRAGRATSALAASSLLGLVLADAVVPLRAQEVAGEANSQSRQAVTAFLDYQEVSYSFNNWGVSLKARSAAFKQEPAFGGSRVNRGMLQLGGPTTNEMAFAWDRGARKLYLDLNRNLDLTDDPVGVFSCGRSSGDYYQTFTNVHLPCRTPAGDRQALVDLNFYNYRSLSCSAAVRSLWQGRVTLQGEDWQAGLLLNPFGRGASRESGNLLLRPWNDRNRSFSQYGGSLETFPFSRKLFFGRAAYQVQYTNETQADSSRLRLEFAEQLASLGDLRITGDSIERVMLEGGSYLVVLDRPGSVAKVPVGRYSTFKVCLRKGDTQAHLNDRMQAANKPLTVSEKAPTVLRAGGPLTNSVSVSRRGKNLSLNYELVGAGGVYEMVNQDRTHPPEFTVYQGDRKVASGKFEFG
jgi:hypothetical protein